MRTNIDGRGTSYFDVFPVLPGQINISHTLKGQRRGFHLHKYKTDYWFCLSGRVKVVLITLDYDLGGSSDVFEEKILEAGEELEIKPFIWHAYEALEDATLVYYETAKSGVERSDDAERPLNDYEGFRA